MDCYFIQWYIIISNHQIFWYFTFIRFSHVRAPLTGYCIFFEWPHLTIHPSLLLGAKKTFQKILWIRHCAKAFWRLLADCIRNYLEIFRNAIWSLGGPHCKHNLTFTSISITIAISDKIKNWAGKMAKSTECLSLERCGSNFDTKNPWWMKQLRWHVLGR